jgi:hypothetical protein
VRVGYKASLSTDVCTEYRACDRAKEKSDVGTWTNQQSWELLRSQKMFRTSTSGGPLDLDRSVGFRVNSYLVDPASSHMLVSKIKPCMSKYKQICTVKLRMAH